MTHNLVQTIILHQEYISVRDFVFVNESSALIRHHPTIQIYIFCTFFDPTDFRINLLSDKSHFETIKTDIINYSLWIYGKRYDIWFTDNQLQIITWKCQSHCTVLMSRILSCILNNGFLLQYEFYGNVLNHKTKRLLTNHRTPLPLSTVAWRVIHLNYMMRKHCTLNTLRKSVSWRTQKY